MNFRILGGVLIVVGLVLLIFGIAATQHMSEKIMGGITGHYTNTTMWYIIGGIALIVGGFGLTRIKK